ncbi:ATP-binding protein [Thiomicrorhabdus sediminis]|uniref:histidine kinase n=1 Tax=Thiomicrorhabdus sediminis TaxID=2580412 RepID=A0A4P9K5J9_9GAMM|nr:ATP-binding protein [Thiomicrorhabdus sediminis]QCU90249.1 PAS domain S-box protein [Thiomicrorhabdus sediminis]
MRNLDTSSSLLKLNVKLFIVSIGLLILLSLVSLLFIHNYNLEKVKKQHFTKQALLLEERVDKKAKILHAATLVLANNSIVRQALIYEDRQSLINEMGRLREQFAYWTGFINYAFHAITFDGRSLYKDYDPESYGQDVSKHPLIRKSMADTSRTFTQIGQGGFANVYRIINSQPVFAIDNSEELVGFMTVSQGLKQIVEEFKNDGLEYYVFERLRDSDGYLTSRFVVDRAPYFSKDRQFSDWTFNSKDLSSGSLKLRDGWYYQAHPIFDAEDNIAAFHLIMVPQDQISNQAWIQTLQVGVVLLLAILIVIAGGLLQLGLLRESVLKPMRHLTQALKDIINTERYDKQVQVRRDDEIGVVTDLFNQMLLKTDQLIFDLKYQKIAIDKTLIISRADRYGTITDVNDNFCTISGYSRQELIGQPHSIVRHPEMDRAVFKEMWATIQSKKIWQGEIRNRRKDGSSYYVMSHIIPMLDCKNEIQEYMSIREDITLIVELREGLERALLQAEKEAQVAKQANQAKSEFLASMSHELRTPLNAIIGYAQLLELEPLEDEPLDEVQTILKSGKHLLALINDILDFAKIESGRVEFNFELLGVKDLVSEVVKLTETQAKQKGIQIIVKPMAQDVLIETDRLKCKQVLLNILSNAVKYNRDNGEVILSCEKVEVSGVPYWKMIITDTGVGIRKEDIDKLFEPFNRLGYESSNIQGTGIGLSITKELVEKMKGIIEVESTYGQGSTFSLYFPISKVAVAPALKETTSASASFKILYIGHDLTVMNALVRASAELESVELKIAPTAQNGLDQMHKFNPALVLIDASLSERNQLVTQIEQYSFPIQYISQEDLERLDEIIKVYLNKL